MSKSLRHVVQVLALVGLAATAHVPAVAQGGAQARSNREPGLTDTGVEVGAFLPTAGPMAGLTTSMRDVLEAYFAEVNARGGVHKRKLTLRIFDTPATAAQQPPVFAYVGGIIAGGEAELAKMAREQGVPVIGPATLLTETGTPPARQVFYLLPGVTEQARALANFAASKAELKKARAAVVYGENALAVAAAAAAEGQLKKGGFVTVTRQSFRELGGGGAEAARQLKQAGAEAVFIFGAGGAEVALIKEAVALGWTPRLFMLGIVDGRELLSTAPPAFKDRIFLAVPTVPSDVTEAGRWEFRMLLEKHSVVPRNMAPQIAAFGAAKVLVEGLQRAGRDVTRERLLTALEGLSDFETGVYPRLTYGPNRKVGAPGAYIMMIDPEKKEYVPAGWVKGY